MPFLAREFLSILTFFATVKTMVRTWWNVRSAPDNDIRHNAGSPVQFDKLSIRSLGFDLKDPPHMKLRDQTLEDLHRCSSAPKNEQDHSKRSVKGGSKDQDTKDNIFDLLFVKSWSDDDLIEDSVQTHVEDSNEARVNAAGCSEGTSRVKQENDKDTNREALPVKTESESSVSTTASCHVVWVPWRVWIEHMRNVKPTFHWINPFRRLRKKIKNRTKPPKGSTDGKKSQTENRSREEPAVNPGAPVSDNGEVAINPGPSTADKEPKANPGRNSDTDNTGSVRATSYENWCNFISHHLQWRFPSNRSRGNSYTLEQTAEAQGPTDMHETDDQTAPEVDMNDKTHFDKDGAAGVSLSHNTSINDAWMKVMDRAGPNMKKKGNEDYGKEPSWTNDSSSLQTNSLPSTSVTSKSQNTYASRTSTNKVDEIKNAKTITSIPPNRTTVCAFVRSFKNAKFSWNNPLKRTIPTDKDDTKRTRSADHQVIPGSLENDRNQNFQETPVIAFNNVSVTPRGVRPEGVTQDSCDIPGTSTETATATNNQVDGIKNAKTTTAIPPNRTTVCAFVRSFKNAKYSWNNPLKRTIPTDKDDTKPTGSADHQVIPGSLENDRNQNFQETPVIAFNNVSVTPRGVRLEGVTTNACDIPGTSTKTATAINNQVDGIKNAKTTTAIPQNRTTVCAFVRSFKNAKFSLNNPLKRTIRTGKDDTKPTGSTDDQVIPGSLENDRNQNFQETPVIAFNNVSVTPRGVRPEGVTQDSCDIPGTSTGRPTATNNVNQVPLITPAQMCNPTGQPARAWGMDTGTGATTSNKVHGLKTPNSYTPASLFLATSPSRPSPTIDTGQSTDCRVPSGVPSPTTVPSTENSDKKKKKKKLSFFVQKSKHGREALNQRAFSKRRNTIRPL